jgi:hypothetical protein
MGEQKNDDDWTSPMRKGCLVIRNSNGKVLVSSHRLPLFIPSFLDQFATKKKTLAKLDFFDVTLRGKAASVALWHRIRLLSPSTESVLYPLKHNSVVHNAKLRKKAPFLLLPK